MKMELNNIEKQAKEKLDSRTIQPSTQAWDRLDAMLTVAENEKSKRNYNWLYVAASFLGFILIGTIFLSQTEEINDVKINDVVIENNTIEKSSETSIVEKSSVITPLQTISENTIADSESKKAVLKTKKAKIITEAITYAVNNQTSENNSIINQKTEQKISVVKPIDTDIDNLLANVDKASKNEISTKKSTIKVDASSLLSQVDGELELSFREKVIQSANKNYKTVKVALANRNQE